MSNQVKQSAPANDANNAFVSTTIEAEGIKTNNATTTFVNDANAVAATMSYPRAVPKMLMLTSANTYRQDIIDFLGKPYPVLTGNFSSADIPATRIANTVLPSSMMSIPLYRDKLQGYLGWRGDISVRLVVNGNRFQQGRYIMLWVPTVGSDPSSATISPFLSPNTVTLVQRSQMPHVEVDINCDSEATMVIPFLSIYNFIPIKYSPTNYGSLGRLELWPYAPLVATSGSTTASYTVWISYSNVELIGPAAPQSSSGRITAVTKSKGSISEREESLAEAKGSISGFMVKVGAASKLFSEAPLLGTYATGLSWVSERLAKAATIFGWAKPMSQTKPHHMLRITAPSFCNVDGEDSSLPLSLCRSNAVEVLPGFSGTDLDELDFNFMKTIPSWFQTVTWSTSTTVGNIITAFYADPVSQTVSSAMGARNAVSYAPYQFILRHFSYWRGSFVYKLKFVKTEFHSGRIAICFHSYDYIAGTPTLLNYNDSAFVFREIVDIRNTNEVTIRIPFISMTPWKDTSRDFRIGSIYVFVVDPLVAPATVSSTISIICEQSAGEDFEYAVPKVNLDVPVTGLLPQSASGRIKPVDSTVDTCNIESADIGSSGIVENNVINTSATMGESITSFRTLLKRFDLWIESGATDASTSKAYTHVFPFCTEWLYYDGTLTPVNPALIPTLYGRLNSIFAVSRGGVRLKFVNNDDLSVSNPPQVYLNCVPGGSTGIFSSVATPIQRSAYNTTGTPNTDYRDRPGALITYHNVKTNYVAEVQVPQYSHTVSRSNLAHNCSSNVNLSFSGSSSTTPIVVSYYTRTAPTAAVIVAHGGSDDVNFGMFKSIPPMIPSSTVATY